MGLLSWLFPSPADKLASASRLLEDERFADARQTALALDGDEAASIVHRAEIGLTRKNLEAAVSWAEAGDSERVQIHLELAREYRKPGMDEEFDTARAAIRAIESGRVEEARQKMAAERARQMAVSDGFASAQAPELPLPEGTAESDADELRARLALLVENYPETLRPRVFELGPDFARGVLELDDGEPEAALQILLALPDNEPLVLHERARAAHALHDPAAAATCWVKFAEHAGGHHTIGNGHTAVLLATVQAESGQLEAGVETLREARKSSPELGGALYAQLLEATGQLGEAETVLRDLIQKAGKSAPLYVLLARVRTAGGHRVEAMQALERGLEQTSCPPGRCGYQPPNLALHRSLATLYLEDGIELERAAELAEIARSLVETPTWDDVYLAALVAQKQGAPDAEATARRLWDVTPDGDPRRKRLEAHLPMPA